MNGTQNIHKKHLGPVPRLSTLIYQHTLKWLHHTALSYDKSGLEAINMSKQKHDIRLEMIFFRTVFLS